VNIQRYKTCRFLASYSNVKSMENRLGFECAFIGRSNVGKSSLINALTQRKQLAKTSATPGKTALINLFRINEQWNLVDLPGYGFAKRSKTEQETFTGLIQQYCLKRNTLSCLFVLIDIRHPLQSIDSEFILWLAQHERPFAVILTKSDKLGKQKIKEQERYFENQFLLLLSEPPNLFTCSASDRTGISEISDFIQHLMANGAHE
jgi:GTP-binding protein